MECKWSYRQYSCQSRLKVQPEEISEGEYIVINEESSCVVKDEHVSGSDTGEKFYIKGTLRAA